MWLWRLLRGHFRLFLAAAAGAACWIALGPAWSPRTRAILAWDAGALAYLLALVTLFAGAGAARMEAQAERQQEGEWTLFWLVVAGTAASFAAIVGEFSSMKDAPPHVRSLRLGLVIGTLCISWVVTHATFALRYAHEYYARSGDGAAVDGGLQFPGETAPDYWDFLYFAVVLGMTFQVSDVQITARKLRRLATLHGFLGFVFNTVIVALTVNLASGLFG